MRRLQEVQNTGLTSDTMSSTMLRGVRRLMETRLATLRLRMSLEGVLFLVILLAPLFTCHKEPAKGKKCPK